MTNTTNHIQRFVPAAVVGIASVPEAALERLSELFRYALRLDRDRVETVSLEEEWRFSASYLWLEQMRMGDRLHVEHSLSDDALLCNIPPFTLQPLIENAVRHGLSPKVGIGTLKVHAHEADGLSHLEVSDDGVGATVDALTDSPGIGVRAVRQRLQARYGTRAHLEITGAVGSGVTVAITMPAVAQYRPSCARSWLMTNLSRVRRSVNS